MEKIELTCINCPLGCPLTVTMNGEEMTVSGNTCKRGEDYARKELTNPTRIVTSSVPVTDGEIAMVSVKTKADIPKGRIFACMEEIRRTRVTAPVHIGDVVIEDVAGTGVPVIATKDVRHCV
ncbi:MAG: DUF1667 domain-containing protein [Lachnospiraceae bacterium]